MKIAFIGLGHMGMAMATRLLAAGHELVVYNRTRSKAEPLIERGATLAISPADAVRNADVLVTMLADDTAIESVLYGENGAAASLRRGCLHVSSSTISPECSARIAKKHAAAGQRYVAATVFGRPEAAARGELVVVAAGAPEALEAARPIFDVVGKQTRVVGDAPEKANVVKLAINFVLATMLETLGEAYALVESHGVADDDLLAVLGDSLLGSPALRAYAKKIADRSFDEAGFRLALGAKDVRLAVEAAERAAVPMPIGSVLRDRFVAAIAEGFGDRDWAAVGRASTYRM
ncbi:MAG: NAD(P)-dependent oxidoreductase [Polyangiales bacterium]